MNPCFPLVEVKDDEHQHAAAARILLLLRLIKVMEEADQHRTSEGTSLTELISRAMVAIAAAKMKPEQFGVPTKRLVQLLRKHLNRDITQVADTLADETASPSVRDGARKLLSELVCKAEEIGISPAYCKSVRKQHGIA